jgi:hypothetical protein
VDIDEMELMLFSFGLTLVNDHMFAQNPIVVKPSLVLTNSIDTAVSTENTIGVYGQADNLSSIVYSGFIFGCSPLHV